MSRILGQQSLPASLGVACCDGPHVAIVYLAEDFQNFRILHFAWDRDLRDEEYDIATRQQYVCVVPNLHPAELVALAGYCRKIYRANCAGANMPYNLQYEEGVYFDPDTGTFVIAQEATGLSCATFVVHFFRTTGNPLLRASDWPKPSDEDISRQDKLAKMLLRSNDLITKMHGRIAETQVGCPRIRPEDVAGACLVDSIPAGFDESRSKGTVVMALLMERAAAQ